jgi:hypothetical protein
MIDNALIQKAVVARLKANGALTAKLTSASEIKEAQYQGRSFAYPAVRVAILLQVPLMDWEQCNLSRVTFSVFTLSEQDSSKEADQISFLVNSVLHKKAWSESGFKFLLVKSMGLGSAIRMSERIWRSEAAFITDMQNT